MDKKNGHVESIFPRALLQLLESMRHTAKGEAVYSHMKIFIEQNEAKQMELQSAYIELHLLGFILFNKDFHMRIDGFAYENLY